ncbi:MAG: hypothetical protein O3B41_00805 [Bacteroidetes bacterium]|nr:hypothetical protein [Bacteroidota bacterium]
MKRKQNVSEVLTKHLGKGSGWVMTGIESMIGAKITFIWLIRAGN